MRAVAVVMFVVLSASTGFLSVGHTATLAQGATPASGRYLGLSRHDSRGE